MSLNIEEYNSYAKESANFYNGDPEESVSELFEILDFYNSSGVCAKYPSEIVRHTTISSLSAQDVLSSNSLIIDLELSKESLELLDKLNVTDKYSKIEGISVNKKSMQIAHYLEEMGNSKDISEQVSNVIFNIADNVKEKLSKSPEIRIHDLEVDLETRSSSYPTDDSGAHVDGVMSNIFPTSKMRFLTFFTTLKGNGIVIYDKPVIGHSFQGESGNPQINVTKSIIDSAINTSVSQATIHTDCCNNNMSIYSGPEYSSERLLMSMSFSIFH
jgi:hypothetical protein